MPRPLEGTKYVHVSVPLKDYDRLVREAKRETNSRVATAALVGILFWLDNQAKERRELAAERRAARKTATAKTTPKELSA